MLVDRTEKMGDVSAFGNYAGPHGTYDRRSSLHDNAKSLAQSLNNYRRSSEQMIRPPLQDGLRAWSSSRLDRCIFSAPGAGGNIDGSGNTAISYSPHNKPARSLSLQHPLANSTFLDNVGGLSRHEKKEADSVTPLRDSPVQELFASVERSKLQEKLMTQEEQIEELKHDKDRLIGALVEVQKFVRKAKKNFAGQQKKLELLKDYCLALELENNALRMQQGQFNHHHRAPSIPYSYSAATTPTYTNGGTFFPDNESVASSHGGDSFYHSSHRSISSYTVSEYHYQNPSLGGVPNDMSLSNYDLQCGQVDADGHADRIIEEDDPFEDGEDADEEQDEDAIEDEDEDEDYRQYEDLEQYPVLKLK